MILAGFNDDEREEDGGEGRAEGGENEDEGRRR